MEYNEGIEKYGLEPCYGIHVDPFDYKGYVHVQIPKGEDVLYPFIDFIYESWGTENAGIREHEQGVYIAIKTGESIYQILFRLLWTNCCLLLLKELLRLLKGYLSFGVLTVKRI